MKVLILEHSIITLFNISKFFIDIINKDINYTYGQILSKRE